MKQSLDRVLGKNPFKALQAILIRAESYGLIVHISSTNSAAACQYRTILFACRLFLNFFLKKCLFIYFEYMRIFVVFCFLPAFVYVCHV